MTFLTPIILGVLIIAALAGITYIGVSLYDVFTRGDFELTKYHQRLHTLYRVFKVSVILAIILSVLELFL